MATIVNAELHPWRVTTSDALTLQCSLVNRLVSDQTPDMATLKTVAGVDVSVKKGQSCAAIAVYSYPDLLEVEQQTAIMPTQFPYIPGLLGFREGEIILRAYERLQIPPDILVFDGHGQAHPRRLGIAAHIGLWIDRPTIGCGKSLLTGTHAKVGALKGDYSPLIAKDGAIIGCVLRTRTHVKPVYVSPGHRCDLATARLVTLACTTRYRLPEPIREAHMAAWSGNQPGQE